MAEGCQTKPEYFAGSTSNMGDAWREDLKMRENMERYVRQRNKREEALDFAGFSDVSLEHSFVRQTFAMFRNLPQ